MMKLIVIAIEIDSASGFDSDFDLEGCNIKLLSALRTCRSSLFYPPG